ncbi:hypothetical protein KIPB_004878 [Kipferlia bialata]|uniref:Uncharacterized protein n=1 Tax=Kipferlia bialata TaxID=797122 RepID=A0A9K3CUQ0_9EUKA|nr:hypothetical protein KIPB_004878 [Kipferlia bialata]|eukprot:g4878.t1
MCLRVHPRIPKCYGLERMTLDTHGRWGWSSRMMAVRSSLEMHWLPLSNATRDFRALLLALQSNQSVKEP